MSKTCISDEIIFLTLVYKPQWHRKQFLNGGTPGFLMEKLKYGLISTCIAA